MALTKFELKKALDIQSKQFDQKLRDLQKNIIVEISRFLEEHVLEPIFGLKKDVSVLKKDVSVLKKDVREIKHTVEQTNRRIDAVLERGDRQGEKLENHEKRITKLEKISPISP